MAQEQPDSIALPVIFFLLIGAGIIYIFGYARAVMHRANSDYKKTKAGLPDMRKAYWVSWWRTVKVGFWIAVAAVILSFWAYGDVTEDRKPATTKPASVPSSSKR